MSARVGEMILANLEAALGTASPEAVERLKPLLREWVVEYRKAGIRGRGPVSDN